MVWLGVLGASEFAETTTSLGGGTTNDILDKLLNLLRYQFAVFYASQPLQPVLVCTN